MKRLLICLLLVSVVGCRKDQAGSEYNQGNRYAREQNWDAAIASYTEAIRVKPDYAEAYMQRGLAYFIKGDLDNSITDLTEVIRLDPGKKEAYHFRGNAYKAKGDQARAEADYAKARELGYNPKAKKETSSKPAEESSKNASPVSELTINDVVGSYENDPKKRSRSVFLDNGTLEMYMLRDLRLVDFHASMITRFEKQLVDWTKKYGKDNSATKSIAKMLAAEKEKLAAEEEKLAAPEFPKNFKKYLEGKWEIKDGEVHCQAFGVISVYEMEPNGDLTGIQVVLKNGSRMDIPKEKQKTLQKIK